MYTLALDTSTSLGGVAVLKQDLIITSLTWEREGSHGEHLTPAIEKCLETANIEAKDLTAIALGRGPGSFTGVRIAVNAARALSFVTQSPVYCFDTTEILAEGCQQIDLPLLVLVNAHKNLLYSSVFHHDAEKNCWVRTIDLEARSILEITSLVNTPHLCVGDGYTEYERSFPTGLKSLLIRHPSVSDDPQPDTLGLLSWKHRSTSRASVWKEVQALYVRASGAEEKLRESLEKSDKN
jgi:tRNA threonylcarbamoyladenosine biosynthesis protein TsaB